MRWNRILQFAVLVSAAATRPAASACPSGLAAKFADEGEWYVYLGRSLQLSPGDRVTLQFAVNASFEGTVTVGADDGWGRTGYQVLFGQDLASDADYGDLVPVLPAAHGVWHEIRAEFDIATQNLVISVDGVACAPRPFDLEDVRSIQAFRVDVSEGGHDLWIDTLRLAIENSAGSRTLVEADFEVAPPAAPSGLQRRPASEAGSLPPGCKENVPTIVARQTWTVAKDVYR